MVDLEAAAPGRMMYRYHAFGGSFETALEFPELTPDPSGSDPDWILERSPGPAGAPEGWLRCGSAPVEAGVESVLFRAREAGTLRLVYGDTGSFDIDADGRRIVWHAPAGVDESRARKDVLGRVFALAFQQRGIVTLHGSAVSLGAVGVCFIAPKYHGKSTTAAALVDAGGTLLADDMVVLAPGPHGEIRLLPTLSTVNLWPDAAERVGRDARPVEAAAAGAKVQMRFASASGADDPGSVPLAGVYVLAPTADAERRIERTRLDPPAAAMALLGQLKVGELLGARAVFDLLPMATRLADQVGVHRLDVPRDLARLPELVAAVRGWHAGGEP